MNKHRLETTDIFRGAFFLCKGGDLSGIRLKDNGKRIATFMIRGEGLDKLDKDYRNGLALVNPLQFRESLNHLRDILFNTLRQRNGGDKNERSRKYVAGPEGAEDPAKGGNRKRKDRGNQERR